MRRIRKWVVSCAAAGLACAALIGSKGLAQSPEAPAPVAPERPKPSAPPAPAKPEDVTVGIYIDRIHELSLKENYFTADFYVWFRWRNGELAPYKTFSMVDARIESQTEPITKELPNGEHYAYVRVVARVTKFWDITEYPLDRHDLTIAIEEDASEDHLIRYVADTTNSGADPKIDIPGWTLHRTSSAAGIGEYRCNFGDVSLPTGNESRYGRFAVTMHFSRQGTLYFMKLFFGLWISAAIAFLAFFIRPQDVDPRFGLGVGAR